MRFYLARHFGFCYGVENAIEISYKALAENKNRNVYLLSQMIHNEQVNTDLRNRGIRFIMDTDGTQFIGWDKIGRDDVVIIQLPNISEFVALYSDNFDPDKHLRRIGVVNQTTMLASETQAIAEFLKLIMIQTFGAEKIKEHFADTRDTLCYATNDNQEATYALLKTDADFVVVVGGYNSSNTSHIVELCESRLPTFFINSEEEIRSGSEIHHFNYHRKEKRTTWQFIPDKRPVSIVLTSGASCPDTLVDKVMLRLVSLFADSRSVDNAMAPYL